MADAVASFGNCFGSAIRLIETKSIAVGNADTINPRQEATGKRAEQNQVKIEAPKKHIPSSQFW
jgi:hypothetical protein